MMSVESTRQTLQRYADSAHTDLSMLSEDVVFTVMATGQESRGREAVQGLLYYFYHIAFDAVANPRLAIFGDSNGAMEFDFVGKHTGEFAGVPATGKEVNVPLCVVYDLENDLIKRGRIYFEIPALLQQLGVAMG